MVTRNPLFLREEELDRSLELLLLAERDVLAQSEAALDRLQLSEADFKVLYIVQRHAGVTTAELCAILGMTKQSLSRHIRHLVASGLLEQGRGTADRRKRPLTPTDAALAAIDTVNVAHKRGLKRAFSRAGPEAVEGFQRVLAELIGGPGRRLLSRSEA